MNTQSLPFRVFAVCLSLTLLAALVYQRCGGDVLGLVGLQVTGSPTGGDQVQQLQARIDQLESKIDALLVRQGVIPSPVSAEPTYLPASSTETVPSTDFLFGPKSAPVFLPSDAPPTTPAAPELLPGSKSDAVFQPQDVTQPSKPVLLPGSKYIVIADPLATSPAPPGSPSTTIPSPTTPGENPPRASGAPDTQRQGNQPDAAPKLLPGSKSRAVFSADDVTPPVRAQPKPAPQPQQSRRADQPSADPPARLKLLPGSKSAGVIEPAELNNLPRQQAAQPSSQSVQRP